jgi:hypothetical protein
MCGLKPPRHISTLPTAPRVGIADNQIATGLVPKLPSNQRLWSERATLIGLSDQETDYEQQRSDPIEQSTAP